MEKNVAAPEENVEQLMVMRHRMVVEKNVAAPDEDVEQLHHLMEQLMVKVEQMKKCLPGQMQRCLVLQYASGALSSLGECPLSPLENDHQDVSISLW